MRVTQDRSRAALRVSRYRPLSIAVGLILTTSGSVAAVAGELRGTVTVTGAPRVQRADLNPYPGTAGSAEMVPRRFPSATTEVVLSLAGEGLTPRAGNAQPELVQINKHFEPRVLGVTVGTTVEFPNEDLVFHNVFSYSKTKRFDLGYYGKGKSKNVTFDKPGVVKVFCDIHSNMAAFIYVTEAKRVTHPDVKGGFAFTDIPAGTYTLRAWHPDVGEQLQQVTIGEGVTYVDVTL